MKTFKSGISGMGLQIQLDTKGIHLIKRGVLGVKDDFHSYGFHDSLVVSTSFIGITTIVFNEQKIKGFDENQANEIKKIYELGVNDKIPELIEMVGIDGQEYEDTPQYMSLIQKYKADWLQKQADKAAELATEALNAQTMAAQAAAQAAAAYDRQRASAVEAISNVKNPAVMGTVPPPIASTSVYVAINGQQQGPYNLNELSQLIQQGSINKSSMVWKEGLPSWTPAEQLPELNSLFTSSQVPPALPQ